MSVRNIDVEQPIDDSRAADFSKLGYSERGNIYCSEVCQKVFIQVDRNGTKAAAITWGNMKDEMAMKIYSVILDRPFVYAIVDMILVCRSLSVQLRCCNQRDDVLTRTGLSARGLFFIGIQ